MSLFKFVQPRLNYSFSFKEKIIALCSLFSKPKLKSSLVSSILDSENIYFFDNARSGLQLALSLLSPNSKVGVQPFTCPTVLEAIESAQCTVSFIDINDSLVIDKQCLADRVEHIDALILTHTFGYPADVNEIKSMLGDKLLIEDCAHAFMSENENGLVGKTGDFAIFSHGFAKFPSALQGGYLLLNNLQYADAFQHRLKAIGAPVFKDAALNLLKSVLLSMLNNVFIYNALTFKIKAVRKLKFNYRKPVDATQLITSGFTVNKAVFENQLLKIDEKLQKQQNNGLLIIEALKVNPSFKVCQLKQGQNFFMIPVLVKNPDHFITFARLRGIEIGRHFVQSIQIIHHFGYHQASCPNYERLIGSIVTIPTHYNYPIKKSNRLLSIIKEYSNE